MVFEPESIARLRKRRKPVTPIEPPKEELPEFEPEPIARMRIGRPPIPPPARLELPELLQRAYPELDFDPETSAGRALLYSTMQWMEEQPETFLKEMRAKGRTPEAESLLATLGLEAEDIEELYAPWEMPEEGIQFVEEVEGIQRLFTIRPDFTVEQDGEEIGVYDPETDEITPVEIASVELAKRNLEVAWSKYTTGEFNWGEFGNLALGGLGVAGAYIEKYVGRPWETALLEARSRYQIATGFGTAMDEVVLQRFAEAREKYGWAGALIAEDVSDIWHEYIEESEGPGTTALKIAEWINPAYVIPIGGTFGLFARLTSKIPLLGKAVKATASGVQALERGITYPIAKPLELGVRYGAKGAEMVGNRLGKAVADRIIRATDNLLLEIPASERLLDGVLVDNWMKRALTIAAKIPPIKVGIEKALGWRVLTRREAMVVEDIVGRGGVIHAEINRMGTNAKAIKYWELQDISRNPTKLFGFDRNAYSAKLGGNLEEIFAKPEAFKLTAEQLAYVSKFREVGDEVTNLLIKEGVPPEHLIEDWVHRIVLVDKKAPRVSRAIKSRPSYEKHRKFETMADGIEYFMKHPTLKAHYAPNPELLMSDYIQQAFKKIADERFVQYIAKEMGVAGKAFGVKPSEKLIRYPELFEEITSASGRELAEKAVLRTEELTAAKQFENVMNRALRGETPHVSTLAMLERKFPELGKRFSEALGKRAELQAIKLEVKALAEARKVPFWEAKTERAFRMEQLRQPEIGEGYIMQPFAGGRLYEQEFIDSFNKFFGHKGGLPGLQVTSDVAGILRITKAALDFSFQAIQGLPSWGLAHAYMLKDPKMGMRLLGEWYKTWGQATVAFFRPEVLAASVKKVAPEAMERVSFGGSARAVDYFQVLWTQEGLAGQFQRVAGKIPFKPYDRAEIAFFGAGELVRDRFWKILAPKAIRQGKEFELARFLDRITGITDSATLGVPLSVRQFEQTFMWFAPNYTRACLTVLSDIFKGGYTGAMTREALGGMIAAGSAMYSMVQYGISTLEGRSDEQAWKDVQEGFGVVTDPITGEVTWKPTGRFMTIKVGNYYMGFGGFWYGLMRLSGNIMACVNEVGNKERIDLVRIIKNGTLNKQDNPFVYWWFSRSSPFFGAGFELASGKDFLGYPLETTEDYMKYVVTRFEPIWMEQGLNWMIPGMARENEVPEGLARQALIPAELFGMRTFPESNWVKFYDKVNELIPHIPREELDPKQMEAWQEGTLTWKQLTDIQKINLISRYPELNEIYGMAQGDSAIRGSENWKQWQGRVEEEKTTYYERGDSLVDRMATGELDTREFREKWSDAGQNYGITLDAIEKEPAYYEIYKLFEDKEAKGEKYGFADDIALQEYINITFADYLDEKGDIDWDAKDVVIGEYIEKWGEDTYQRIRQMYADKKLLEGLNPTLIRMADDKEKLSRDYWRLPYKPINEMDEEDETDGNIPAEYLALWKQYQTLETDAEKEAFIEANPEFGKDWRAEFRQGNAEQDAMLALWGYGGKLQSREAYDMVVKWGQELGIPLEQMGLGLPPPILIDDYFELNKIVTETSGSSIEARLFKIEHPAYLEWGLEQGVWKDDLTDESIESLRLRIKHKDTLAEYELIEDRDEQKAFRLSHPEFNDDRRRIIMYDLEAPPALIEKYVEYGKIVDQYGGNSPEAKLFKIDNPELHTFGQGEEVFKWDDLADEKIPVLRINEQYRNEDEEYDAILFEDAIKQREARDAYLTQHPEYAIARRKRDAYQLGLGDYPTLSLGDVRQFLQSDIVNELQYKLRITVEEVEGRKKVAPPFVCKDFTKKLIENAIEEGFDLREAIITFQNPPRHQISEKGWEVFASHSLAYFEVDGKRLFIEPQTDEIMTEVQLRDYWGEYGIAEIDYGKRVLPQNEELIDTYVGYYDLPERGYRRERFLLENKDLYKAMLELKEIMPFEVGYKVPAVQYDEIYETYQVLFDKYATVEGAAEERRTAREKILDQYPEFAKARLRRMAYGKFIPETYVEDFVGYYGILALGKPDIEEEWYEDDWFLMEHPEFHQTMVDLELWDERDFGKVPTREVYSLMIQYGDLEKGTSYGSPRFAFRHTHQALEDYFVDILGMTPVGDRWKVKEEPEPEEPEEKETLEETLEEMEEKLKKLRG